MIDPIINNNGVTIQELKEWLSKLPNKDPETGEDKQVWMSTGVGLSSPVCEVWSLNIRNNSCDVCLEAAQHKGD